MNEISVALLIPSWGTSDYVELAHRSMLENSMWPENHQFLVHFNQADGRDVTTVGKLREIDPRFNCTMAPVNDGVSLAYKKLTHLVEVDFVLPMNSDMYFLPGWDKALAESIEDPDEPGIWRSPALIEAKPTKGDVSVVKNFGSTIDGFREQDLLDWVKNSIRTDKKIAMEPQVIRTIDWRELGGWDINFWPGFCGDPDWTHRFYNKFHKGHPENMHNVPNCLIYHFVEITTDRFGWDIRNKAHRQFEEKWGYSTRHFEGQIFNLGKIL